MVDRGLNVRQTEKLVQQGGGEKPAGGKGVSSRSLSKDSDTVALERDLTNSLGMKVEINHVGSGGTLVVRYDTLEELDDLLHRLTHGQGPITDD